MADMNQDLRVTYELVQTKVQDKAAKQSEKSLSKLTASAAHSQAMMAAAAGAAVGAIAAIAGAMFLTVGAASKFEESFAGIRKTVDGSEGDFRKLGGQIRDLAQEIPVTTSALNQIGELGGQLGVSISGLENFIETIAKLGVATRLSTENAALGLARLSEIFNLPEGEIDNLASSLVDLGNNFAALEDEILSTSLRLAAGAKVAGATVADVLGIATALQAVGVQSQAGGTAMARVFQQIQIAASSGGKQLETFVRVTGLSVEAFQELAKEDPAQVLNVFVQELARISKTGGNTVAILDELGLKQQRTIRALLAVGEAEDLLTRTLVTSNTAFEANIALTEEAEKRFDTFKSQTKLLVNEVNELRIQIGTKLLPTARAIVSVFSGIVNAFQNTDTTSKSLSATLKLLNIGIVAITGASAALAVTKQSLVAVTAAEGLELDQINDVLKDNRSELLRTGKAAGAFSKIAKGLKTAIPVVGVALIALTAIVGAYKRSQEKANEVAEKFLDGRVASISITSKVIEKEKEYQEAINAEVRNETRIKLLEAELEALKEIEARIKSSVLKDFFKSAGLDKEEAEAAQLGIEQVSKEVAKFFDTGVNESFKEDLDQVFNLTQADQSLELLNAHLEKVGTSFSEVAQDPEMMLQTFAALEQQGIPAFELFDRILGGVEQATRAADLGLVNLSDTSKAGIQALLDEKDALDLIGDAMSNVKLDGDALDKVMQTTIDTFNNLESQQNETAVTLDMVQDDFQLYIDILKALDNQGNETEESQLSLTQAAFDLAGQVETNIEKIREYGNAIDSLGRIAPKSFSLIMEGLDRTEDRVAFLTQGIIDLAEAGNVKLAMALSSMPVEESIGLLLGMATASKEEIDALEKSIVSTNEELRNLSLTPEQIGVFVEQQELALQGIDLQNRLMSKFRIEAEAAVQAEEDLRNAAFEVVQMSEGELDAQEEIANIKKEIAKLNEDLVVGQFKITQEKIREVELLEAQQGFAEAIDKFGKEGVITNTEELSILQQQMNLTKMRDKLEGKMSNRDKQRLRDKQKEVKFLKLAVEQGVAEQLDLDVAQDELDKLKDPRTDNEEKVLDLQVKIAEAELAITEAQAKRLDPSVISAMEQVNDALNLGDEAAQKMADSEQKLADAIFNANIQAAKNEDRINELLLLYPNLRGVIAELGKDMNIPPTILQAALDGMDTIESRYTAKVDDLISKGYQAAIDAQVIGDLIKKGLEVDFDMSNFDVEAYKRSLNPNFDPRLTDTGRSQFIVDRFGDPDMNNYTGGNVPIGRTSVVGELGPETIMSTPSGTSVFANRQNASSGGVTVANMNVNITGLPADPISARKAAINIRRELNKLESEGTAGTGLRNR